MTTINRTQLLNDTKTYLYNNQLDDAIISSINEGVIVVVGDDNSKYSEVLCKSLRAAATQNKVSASVSGAGGLKRQKVGPIEEEFYDGSTTEAWDEYLKHLPELCPVLPGGGYTLSVGIGITINPGDEIDVNDTSTCTISGVGFSYS